MSDNGVHSLVLDVRDVRKAFGGVHALRGANLTLLRGEVHALVGENGAGKSTLIKILSGAFAADSGEILLAGRAYAPHSPREAKANGIQVVHQEFNLLPYLTVAENICFENFPKKALGLLDRGTMQAKAKTALAAIGLDEIDVNTTVNQLGIAHRQLIEIARALQSDSRILILDEPTATLTERETSRLFAIIKSIKARGVTVIFVSHHLDEVFKICDRVTVFRSGSTISTAPIESTSPREVVRNMVGRELGEELQHAHESYTSKEIALEVSDLNHAKSPPDANISFQLHKGEILGIAGLVGAGRTEILRAIFGVDAVRSGQIKRNGVELAGKTPSEVIASGIGFVTEDRKGEGLILNMPIAANSTLVNLWRFAKAGLLNQPHENEAAIAGAKRLKLKYGSVADKASSLSGGNQQKVVLSKWLANNPEVLMLDEPTRGVDVGAKAEIYGILRGLAKDGVALLIVSSELPELMTLCDRIMVLSNHRLRGELDRSGFAQEKILQLAYNQT